ncbi:UvrD-helicase domain-containing protein, partial [bacterium]|nr:UvrD-helicase domain-containing protein [bacterium]
LVEITQSLHRIRVSTLDAFFVKLAGNFAQELGLPAGWSIVDEADEKMIKQRAVERMLQRDSKSLLRILNLMQKGETKRSVSNRVLTTVSDLYQQYRISDEPAWNSFPQVSGLSDKDLDAAIKLLQSLRPDKKSMQKQQQACLSHALQGNWTGFTSGKFCENIEKGELMYSRSPIPDDLAESVLPLIQHARAILINQWASQNARTYELLDRFHTELNALKHSRKMFQFDDMNHFLQPAHLETIGPRVQYRMDGRVTNLLLDEFQDTSLSQWNAIQPFANNSAQPDDPTRSFFCVGDVKQAIYGWRGGDAAIFETIERSLPVKASSLERSYRSSQVVIDTVNTLFERLERHPSMGNQQAGVEQWLEGFSKHSTARDDLQGYARLTVGPIPREGQKETDAAFQFAASEIAAIRRRAPQRTIGVLARKKDVVRRMVHALRREGVAASEEGANPLVDSAVVQAMLSLFTLADHPSDSIAAFHVSNSPLMKTRLLSRFEDFNSHAVSRFLRKHLMNVGYSQTVIDVADDLQDVLNERERRRIFQLIEVAGDYDRRSSLRPVEFVDFVEQKPVSESSPDLVRVMTIHQSKGLEFDVVVLPELDWKLFHNIKCVWSANDDGKRTAVYIYRGGKLHAGLNSEAVAAFDETYARLTGEALSLLYVAVTRAVHELQMIVPASSLEKIPLQKASGYMRAALYGTGPMQAGQVLYETGNENWAAETAVSKHDSPTSLEHTLPPKVALKSMSQRSRGIDRQAPSSKGHRRTKLSSLLDSQSEGAMNYGTVMHRWFEQIEWIEDGIPSDDQLRNSLVDPGLSNMDLEQALEDFREALKSKHCQTLLSRKPYSSSKVDLITVERERRFTVRVDQALVNGTIDRLVICRQNGTPVAADIIDFKTDNVSTAKQIQQKAKDYRDQLELYRSAVSKLFRLDSKFISARLLFTRAGRVAQL